MLERIKEESSDLDQEIKKKVQWKMNFLGNFRKWDLGKIEQLGKDSVENLINSEF